MKFLERLRRSLASLRLTLTVLGLLAVLAGLGSLIEPGMVEAWVRDRFGPGAVGPARLLGLSDLYRSPVFVASLALLAINVTICTWSRRSGMRSETTALRRLRWLDALAHGSLVLILAGGMVRASFGDLGTQYIFLDRVATGMRRWPTGEDAPFGFGVTLVERKKIHQPLKVRLRVAPAADPGQSRIVALAEGALATPLHGGLELRLSAVDWQARTFRVATNGENIQEYTFDMAGGDGGRAIIGAYEVKALEYREAVADVHSRIAIIEEGRTVAQGWLTPRSKVSYRGLTFHQIEWGENQNGAAYSGVQVSRDPGAPIFWCGAVLLCLSLPAFMMARHARRGM